MKVAELIDLLSNYPKGAYVSINLNKEEPDPNWLIDIDTVYGYEDDFGDYIVEISAREEDI